METEVGTPVRGLESDSSPDLPGLGLDSRSPDSDSDSRLLDSDTTWTRRFLLVRIILTNFRL